MEHGMNDYNINEKKLIPKKGLARFFVQIGAKTVNSSALLQCGLVNAPVPTQQLFEAIWKLIFPEFSWEVSGPLGDVTNVQAHKCLEEGQTSNGATDTRQVLVSSLFWA
jgi:hypothetical protein